MAVRAIVLIVGGRRQWPSTCRRYCDRGDRTEAAPEAAPEAETEADTDADADADAEAEADEAVAEDDEADETVAATNLRRLNPDGRWWTGRRPKSGFIRVGATIARTISLR
jgi:hypothetical protein